MYKEETPFLTNGSTDWEHFRQKLDEHIETELNLYTTDDVEIESLKFTKTIQKSAWESTPQSRRKLFGVNYPRELRDLIVQKRRLRKKWHLTRSPADKHNFNNASQTLKRSLRAFKDDSINSYVASLSTERSSGYSLWKCTKRLKRPIKHIPPIKKSDGKWARSDSEKANAFAETLMATFSTDDAHDHDDAITNQDSNVPSNEILSQVTVQDIKHIIQRELKNKKSPGFDNITAEVLKKLTNKAISRLTDIINACLALKYVPTCWKVAVVIMIPKPGKPPHESTSYRPISLLPTISKVFEKVLLERLQLSIERSNLIPQHQFGFRAQHSTTEQIHRITSKIEKSFENQQVCSAIFLDVAKAFDKVWHAGLVKKLRSILPPDFCDIIESYLQDRFFQVKYENEFSELKPIKAGVPQGSILGPVLYLLYAYDMPTPRDSFIATFADDTAILTVDNTEIKSTQKLQNAVDEIAVWTTKWKIALNNSKSAHINFTTKKITCPPISIFGNQVPYSNTAKYLGMTLDAKLKWKEHIKMKKDELEMKLRNHQWLLSRNSQLSVHCKLTIYNQILKPVWMYGAQLWGCAKKSNIEVIQRFQNKILRTIVNAPWYIRNSDLHRDLKVPTITAEINKLAASHQERLRLHPNQEASNLLNTSNLRRRLKRTKPFELVAHAQ